MTTIFASRPRPVYRKYAFTYRFDGADWTIEVPALSLEEAKARVRVLGFARYEGEAPVVSAPRPSPPEPPRPGWFRTALRSA